MTPESLRNGSALKGREGIGEELRQATTTVNVDAVADVAVKELRDRGISNPESFLDLASPDGILGACRWFDAQQGRIGTGMLVVTLRSGGKPGWQPDQRRDIMAEQREYGHSIVAWLHENFPDLCDPTPHPGAIVAVIRLHHVHGKGRLTKREHGQAIRAFVKDWEARLLPAREASCEA